MYGKSYDGVTGLVGEALHPRPGGRGVAGAGVRPLPLPLHEPVRFENSLATPALYDAIAGTPGITGDSIAYQQNALDDSSRPGCPALNWADQQDPNHSSPYWQQRDLIAKSKGATTPLLMTQGFIENNPSPTARTTTSTRSPVPSAPGSACGTTCAATTRTRTPGASRWSPGLVRRGDAWYDRYLKGVQPAVQDPPLAVESSDGKCAPRSSGRPLTPRPTRKPEAGQLQPTTPPTTARPRAARRTARH